jgi:hypothetical protein
MIESCDRPPFSDEPPVQVVRQCHIGSRDLHGDETIEPRVARQKY